MKKFKVIITNGLYNAPYNAPYMMINASSSDEVVKTAKENSGLSRFPQWEFRAINW